MFKPLLAATASASSIKFPVLASPKIDGIRCLITEQGAVTRTLKPIPNKHIRACLANCPPGYDGELLTFTNKKRDDFNTVQSKVMRSDGQPDFQFMVFDNFNAKPDFVIRLATIDPSEFVQPVTHVLLEDHAQLDRFEKFCVETEGWEGVMLRDPKGRYKHGRSTEREGILLKLKRFDDDEAIIVDFIEQMENQNEATTNALGHTERSSAKDGLVPKGTLGALSCRWRDVTFELGTGFDQSMRDEIWGRRDELAGAAVTFKFQGTGPNGKPRFPSFKAIRA